MALMLLAARWAKLPSVRAAWRRVETDRAELSQLRPASIDEGCPMRPALSVAPEWMAGARLTFAAPDGDPEWSPIVVVTVDHGLRPGSAEEAAFVAIEARRLGFPHQTLTWTGEKPDSGIAAAARATRYRLLHELVEAETWAWRALGDPLFGRLDLLNLQSRRPERAGWKRALVTAHHLDDQAETFLMRLARGSSPDGLASMRQIETFWASATPERSYRSYYQVVRPLLGATKDGLQSLLRASGQAWREDPTNADERGERVRVRKALPVLAGLGIEPEQIGMATARLAFVRENVRSRVGEDVRKVLVSDNGGLYAHVAPTAWEGWPFDRVMRVLRFLLAVWGGSAPRPEFGQLALMTEILIRTGKLEKQTIAGCVIGPPPPQTGAQPWDLMIWRESGRMNAPDLAIAPGHYGDWDNGRFRVHVLEEAPAPVTVRALGEDGWREIKRRVPALSSWKLPPGAQETLPAIWQGGHLVTVPFFENIPKSLGWLKAEIDHEWEAQSGLVARHYRSSFGGYFQGEYEAGLLFGQRE